MDQTGFNIVYGVITTLMAIIGFGVAWWVNNMWGMLRSQQEQISELNIKIVANYVPRAELQAIFEKINDKLDDIQKRMHSKDN